VFPLLFAGDFDFDLLDFFLESLLFLRGFGAALRARIFPETSTLPSSSEGFRVSLAAGELERLPVLAVGFLDAGETDVLLLLIRVSFEPAFPPVVPLPSSGLGVNRIRPAKKVQMSKATSGVYSDPCQAFALFLLVSSDYS